MTGPSTAADPVLRRSTLVAFSLPTLVLGIMHGPEGQIQAIYAKHAGLALSALAVAMLLTRIFDAITYPLIGFLSDRTFARSGTRKGWVIFGTFVSVLGMWNLMRPPAHVDVVYFGVWMGVIYLGWKLMEIPIQAWSYGLSADYTQRNRVQAWRGLTQIVGTFMFFIIPWLAVQIGYSDSTEIDFRSLGLSAIVCAIALPLATLISVTGVSNGDATPPVAAKRPSLADSFQAIKNNGPLLRLLAAIVPANLLSGTMGGVVFLHIDTYLGLSRQVPAIMALALVGSIVGIPFWTWMATRHERHRVWAVALIIGGLSCALFALVAPGPLALPLSFLLYPLTLFSISAVIVVYAMSADIVDYGRLVTGEDHAGLYGSMFAFVQKSLTGVSAAAGLFIAGAFGFDATAHVQSASGILGIKLTVALLPAVGLLGAAAIIWNYSLTRARVAEIQSRLNQGSEAGVERP